MALPLFTSTGRCVGSIFVAWAQSVGLNGRGDSLKDQRWVNSIADVIQAKVHRNSDLVSPSPLRFSGDCRFEDRYAYDVGYGSPRAIGMLPTAYPVRAKVVVEPDQRRWISAPFDAPLKKSHVVPGDHVEIGQLLYSLDCQDLLNKLAALAR